MNNKLLLCGAIAASLLLTACVKKETPKEDEQEQVETTEQVNQPAEAVPLEAMEDNNAQAPAQVEVEREETPNTTTVIRREVREAPQQTTTETAQAEAPKAQQKPASEAPAKSNNEAQSEDDAVAAAIAAATPALDQ
ncbi:internalin [Acinetobacter sp. CS-2]|uniref:internalin n=1 Tax=Acinetobacter sp. CS-2 TaxID=2798861 RepID=UPI00190732CF|nr:internalin [Acinetobacter sp. CS-2]QQN40712.1 internalin [Acinetobacter sp. CS-2]